MGNYQIDPKKQFSKHLARWTSIFWFVYIGWLSAALVLAPEAGLYIVLMAVIVSCVMIVNLCNYNSNSKTEKKLFAMLNEKELELKFGPAKIAIGNSIKGGNSDEENLNSDEEGGGNG